MDKLIEKAIKVLNENCLINEVELSDGVSKVRVVRNVANVTYWVHPYQSPTSPIQFQYI